MSIAAYALKRPRFAFLAALLLVLSAELLNSATRSVD